MGWIEFCQDFGISYDKGKKNIYCKCPWCPLEKIKKKLGLSTSSSLYGCWRNSRHSGNRPAPLISALISVEAKEAEIIAKKYFGKYFNYGSLKEDSKVVTKTLEIPSTFYPFDGSHLEEGQFNQYLKNRRLDPSYVCSRFDLHWSVSKPYSYRLVIPVKKENKWKTWTARAINPAENLRYLTAGIDIGATDPKELLFDYDELSGGETLMITEGPFDSIAISQSMLPGVSSTCIFGKIMSDTQFNMILQLADYYETITVAFDKDAWQDTRNILNRFRFYIDNVNYANPTGKDWAEMSSTQIKDAIYSSRNVA